jgi:hypothetical protein
MMMAENAKLGKLNECPDTARDLFAHASLHASWWHRSLERRREDLGPPLPRLPFRPPRRSAGRTCEP